MTWIKICGTTNLEDALVAVDAGADALGFVFYEKSPRNISVDAAREIVEKLPADVEKVGVFVNGGELDPLNVLLDARLTGMQTYFSPEGGERREGGMKATGASLLPKQTRCLVALPMNRFGTNDDQMQHLAKQFATLRKNLAEGFSPPEGWMDTFMLDSGDLRQPGGTGKTFDWKSAVPVAEGMRAGGVKLVVAGGLTSENVGEAIGILNPWGVDVASGVEERPGKKDAEKVRAFVRAVREKDGTVS